MSLRPQKRFLESPIHTTKPKKTNALMLCKGTLPKPGKMMTIQLLKTLLPMLNRAAPRAKLATRATGLVLVIKANLSSYSQTRKRRRKEEVIGLSPRRVIVKRRK